MAISRLDTMKFWLVFRDARTGKYVSRLYALQNPDTTVSERRSWIPIPKD